jgi:hypothetical protein
MAYLISKCSCNEFNNHSMHIPRPPVPNRQCSTAVRWLSLTAPSASLTSSAARNGTAHSARSLQAPHVFVLTAWARPLSAIPPARRSPASLHLPDRPLPALLLLPLPILSSEERTACLALAAILAPSQSRAAMCAALPSSRCTLHAVALLSPDTTLHTL